MNYFKKLNYRLENTRGTEIDTFETESEARAILEVMIEMGEENLRVVPWRCN